MPHQQQHDDENDPELAEIHKMLDEGEESLDLYGTVSADEVRSGLEEIYARKRAEAAARPKAVND